MKIAVFTDVHANLPALQAALGAIRAEGCDAIYHTGDAIAIGPYPSECMDLLLSIPNVCMIMGNHDAWFAHGLPNPPPSWVDNGEALHQHWVHSSLDPSLRSVVARWPYVVQEQFAGVRVTFLHHALNASASGFAPSLRDPSPGDLDAIFVPYRADVLFYGHNHHASDFYSLDGQTRYVNPGSLGCYAEAVARFVLLECNKGHYKLKKHAVRYDDTALFETFERREVPEREFICQTFFGGRHRTVCEDET